MDTFEQFVSRNYIKAVDYSLDLPMKNTTGSLVTFLADQVHDLVTKLERYKSSISRWNKCTEYSFFKVGKVSTRPFYVWRNKYKKSLISKLLSGEPIVITANLMNSVPYDATKFNSIELIFTSKNQTAQKELMICCSQTWCKCFTWETHTIVLRSKIYLIPSSVQEMRYSFERKQDGKEPEIKQDGWIKIQDGDFVLSLFTTWKLQLFESLVSDGNLNWKSLQAYEDYVDMDKVRKGH